ncbi:MAG: alpha/beta hydrolase [Anaerolineales bacterium]
MADVRPWRRVARPRLGRHHAGRISVDLRLAACHRHPQRATPACGQLLCRRGTPAFQSSILSHRYARRPPHPRLPRHPGGDAGRGSNAPQGRMDRARLAAAGLWTGYRHAHIARRYHEWVGAVEQKLVGLRRAHEQVLLVGYSFGAALSVEVATRVQPDGLILLAPFMWTETPVQRRLLALASPLLPYAFKPYARANFDDPKFRHTMNKFTGGADLDNAELRAALRDFAVPVTLFQEVRQTRRAYTLACEVRGPVLVVQGEKDEVSRPANTLRLVSALPPGTRFVRVDAGHDLIEPASPAWPEVERAVLTFAARVADK